MKKFRLLFGAAGFSLLQSIVYAQTIVSPIPKTLNGNFTLGSSSVSLTANINIPATVNLSNLQRNARPVELTTSSATGNTTIYRGFLTISDKGIITGNGTAKKYNSSGNLTGTSSVSVLPNSRIKLTGNSTVISKSNERMEVYGEFSAGNDSVAIADYIVDADVNFSNNCKARGQIIVSIIKRYNIQSLLFNDGEPQDESRTRFVFGIVGPGGETGSYSSED